MALLSIGTQAPEIKLLDHTETLHTLEQYRGSFVVVYFYPKDDTPGCTKEACMIRDMYADFAKEGIVVLGISKDSPASHATFREKYELPFILLSDPEEKVIQAYGAQGMLFTKRVTYVVNKEGIIVKVYPDVDPAGHAGELLKDVRALSLTTESVQN